MVFPPKPFLPLLSGLNRFDPLEITSGLSILNTQSYPDPGLLGNLISNVRFFERMILCPASIEVNGREMAEISSCGTVAHETSAVSAIMNRTRFIPSAYHR